MNDANPDEAMHLARCSCGKLAVEVCGAPVRINACTCLDCQRRSGSAFTYTAFFSDAAIRAISGAHRVWRELRDSGRWHDSAFCTECGVSVFLRMEALPGLIGIPVGAFNDPAFVAPEKFYWTTRRHHWLLLPQAVEALDTQ